MIEMMQVIFEFDLFLSTCSELYHFFPDILCNQRFDVSDDELKAAFSTCGTVRRSFFCIRFEVGDAEL